MHTHLEQWAANAAAPGEQSGFSALLKGLTSVVDKSCQSWDSNPQPRVASPMLYPLEPRLPLIITFYLYLIICNFICVYECQESENQFFLTWSRGQIDVFYYVNVIFR